MITQGAVHDTARIATQSDGDSIVILCAPSDVCLRIGARVQEALYAEREADRWCGQVPDWQATNRSALFRQQAAEEWAMAQSLCREQRANGFPITLRHFLCDMLGVVATDTGGGAAAGAGGAGGAAAAAAAAGGGGAAAAMPPPCTSVAVAQDDEFVSIVLRALFDYLLTTARRTFVVFEEAHYMSRGPGILRPSTTYK